MLVTAYNEKNVGLLKSLRNLEIEASKIPKHMLSSAIQPIRRDVDIMFKNYINVETLTDEEISSIMNLIHMNKIHDDVRCIVLSNLICRLEKINDKAKQVTRQRTINKFVFGMNW